MSQKWLVIGICGTTCSGKTTLAKELLTILPANYVKLVCQDDYPLPDNDPREVWVPELNHNNYELLSSMEMDKMYDDIKTILKDRCCENKLNKKDERFFNIDAVGDIEKSAVDTVVKTNTYILIIEGFCIFNYKPIEELCDLKYYFTLTEEECRKRRLKRIYERPDCAGYFDMCVWPQYLVYLKEVKESVANVTYFDQNSDHQHRLKKILFDIIKVL